MARIEKLICTKQKKTCALCTACNRAPLWRSGGLKGCERARAAEQRVLSITLNALANLKEDSAGLAFRRGGLVQDRM